MGLLLEELLSPLGIQVFANLRIMTDPPQADILLLRGGLAGWTPEQRAFLPDGIRDSQASHVLLEFKYTESVNEAALRQALGYDTFYRRTHLVGEQELQTFILGAQTPRPETLQRFGYKPAEVSGVYHSDNVLLRRLSVLVLNELQAAPHNAFVKMFASREQAKQTAFAMLKAAGAQALSQKTQSLVNGLWRKWHMDAYEEMILKIELDPEELIRLGQEAMLSHLPVEELLKYIKPEEIVPHLKPEERLAGLSLEEIEAYLSKLKEAG